MRSRMGGGPVRDTNLRVWGVDLVEEHLLTSLRIPSKPLIRRTPREHLAEYSLNAKRSGRLQHTDFMQARAFLRLPGAACRPCMLWEGCWQGTA